MSQIPATTRRKSNPGSRAEVLHPAWYALIELCERLGYGEIEKLKIQDGLPVLAEMTTQKIKFT